MTFVVKNQRSDDTAGISVGSIPGGARVIRPSQSEQHHHPEQSGIGEDTRQMRRAGQFHENPGDYCRHRHRHPQREIEMRLPERQE